MIKTMLCNKEWYSKPVIESADIHIPGVAIILKIF